VGCVKMAELIEMLFGSRIRVGPRKHVLIRSRSRSPLEKGQFLAERTCPGMPNNNML